MTSAADLARACARTAQAALPVSESGLIILLYHLVGAGTDSPVDLPSEVFYSQMEEIAGSTHVLSVADAVMQIEEGVAFDRLTVALTFDDAYENFATQVWPILDRFSLPATLYVPVGFLVGETPAPIRSTDSLPPLDWRSLRSLVESGRLTIGSHSKTHRDLRRLSDDELNDDIGGSKQELEARLGVAVDSFAYPRALWDRRVEAKVRTTYRSAVVAGGRRSSARSNPLRLSRLPVHRGMPVSLSAVLRAPIWVEEAIADLTRRRLR